MLKKLSIGQKVVALTGGIIIILSLIVANILMLFSGNNTIREFKRSGIELLTALSVDLDVEVVKDILENQDITSESFNEVHKYLNQALNATSLTYLYVMVHENDGKNSYYLVDGNEVDSGEFCNPGDPLEDSSEDYYKTLIEGKAYASEIYNAEGWGEMMTIEVPIYSEGNDRVIVLAADIATSTVNQQGRILKIQLIAVLFCMAIIELILIYIFINSMLSRNFRVLGDMIETTANFDFTDMKLGQNLAERLDEIGEITTSIIAMRGKLREKALEVDGAVEEVHGAIKHIHERIAQQTASTQQVSTSVEELAASISNQVSSTTESGRMINLLNEKIESFNTEMIQISNLAQTTKETSEQNKQSIDKLQTVYKNNELTSKIVDEKMNQLITSSRAIKEIIKVITDLAEQTNLLALNAAIEAARAGEAGKGFGIVADEIKKLSNDTASSTEQIETIITHIVKEVESTNQSMEELMSNNKQVGLVSKEVIGTSNEMEKDIDEILDGMNQLKAFMQDIEVYKDSVKNSNDIIVEGTEQYSAISEEISSCIQDEAIVNEQILQIMDSVKLKVDGLGKSVKEYKL